MIEPQHLRIGNAIIMYVKESTAISSIHLVEPTTLMMIDGSIQSRGMAFRPIPLTEEILLKVRFEIKSNAGIKFISFKHAKNIEFYLPIVNDVLCLSTWQNKMFLDLGVRVQYLHQLQNLYFALTGQELNTVGLVL